MKKLVVFILIFLSFVLQSVGEIQEFRFSQIGIDRGLSHTTVNGISQDASGYIWIATPDGLNRYDGFKFTDFLTDSLDHNVKSVMSDKKGNLFAITSHTLSSYSSTSESFENHTFPHSGSLTTLLPVSADRIAVGSTSGFYYFDIRNHTFSLAPGTAGKNITSTALFDGNVVIGTAKGEVREVAGKQPFSFVLPDHPEVNVLLQDNNSLLIGTEGKGLFRYTPASRRLESVGGGSGINFVRSLLIDSRQRLWVGTFTGLYILDADRKNMVFHDDATASGGALSHSSVRRMFADRQGGVWLGTYYGGLNYYHPQLNQFTTLSKHNSGSLSISGNVAGPMAEDVKGNIWIGTNDGALNIYDPRTREFRKYTRREGLGSDDIKAIYIDEPRRRAYIGTHIGGLSVMDLSSGAITAHRNIAQSVYDILPALDGSKLWLAVLDGIYLLDTNSFESRRVSAPGLPRLTTSLMRDSERRIWISGEDGMAVYGEENGRLKFEKNLPHSSDHVNEVYESPSTGKFWIATHRGLLSYDPATGKASTME